MSHCLNCSITEISIVSSPQKKKQRFILEPLPQFFSYHTTKLLLHNLHGLPVNRQLHMMTILSLLNDFFCDCANNSYCCCDCYLLPHSFITTFSSCLTPHSRQYLYNDVSFSAHKNSSCYLSHELLIFTLHSV